MRRAAQSNVGADPPIRPRAGHTCRPCVPGLIGILLALVSCTQGNDRRQPPTHLVRVTLDGSRERLASRPEPTRDPTTTPDGQYRLVGTSQPETGYDLLVVDTETGDREPFLVSPADEREGALAPNGRWSAYSSNATGRYEIYIRPFPARRGVWQISFEGGRSPLWANDGSEIYYRADDGYVRSVRVDPSEFSVRIGSDRALFEDRFVRSQGYWSLLEDGSFLMLEEDGAP